MKRSIPVVRGFVVTNVLRCYAAQGGDTDAVCEEAGLPPPSEITPSKILPAERYYAMLNVMTERLGDPYFPARAGELQARQGITALVEARRESGTLGDFLTRILLLYRNATSHARYELQDDGARAVIRLRRNFVSTVPTGNIDVMNAVAFVTLFLDTVGWDKVEDLTVSVSDPKKIPATILPAKPIQSSGNEPMSIAFPPDWLLQTLPGEWEVAFEDALGRGGDGIDPLDIETLRRMVLDRIGSSGIEISAVARDLGMSVRQLQRFLNTAQTSFRKLVHEARLSRARQLIADDPKRSIKDVAFECGFSTSQSLSRSFKRQFGESPSDFRRDRS